MSSAAALLIIDVQNDFISGSLAVGDDAESIVPGINELRDLFTTVVVSQDYHPPEHVSFASNHPGKSELDEIDVPIRGTSKTMKQTLWPVHCVRDTSGAQFHADLKVLGADLVERKGVDPSRDSYSAFYDNTANPSGLQERLGAKGIDTVFVCGLAFDYCVGMTALDAAACGFNTFVVHDLCRSTNSSGQAAMRAKLAGAGVTLVGSDTVGSLLGTLAPPTLCNGMIHSVIAPDGLPEGATVEFITDIEGNLRYLERFIARSKVLSWGQAGQLDLAEGGYLVHGGDGVDKGDGDIRVVRLLTRLKRRYPDRVVLIMGNRDVNKLRFGSELAEGETGDVDPGMIYWDPKHVPYARWLEHRAETGKAAERGSLSTLQWMLEKTMGCAETFEARRSELALLGNHDRAAVLDEDVLASFVASVAPTADDPWMLAYLRCGQLAAVLGNTLFVHGGVSHTSMGCVPGSHARVSEAKRWCAALNRYYVAQIAAYEQEPAWQPPREGASGSRSRCYHSILDYGVPGGNGGLTVVYSHMGAYGTQKEDILLDEFLLRSQIRRLVVGHVPQGPMPNIIRRCSGIDVVMGDTSYSDMTKAGDLHPDNRGEAVSVIALDQNETTVRGTLPDGAEHAICLPTATRSPQKWCSDVSEMEVNAAVPLGYTSPGQAAAAHRLNLVAEPTQKPGAHDVVGQSLALTGEERALPKPPARYVMRTTLVTGEVVGVRPEGYKKLTKLWPSPSAAWQQLVPHVPEGEGMVFVVEVDTNRIAFACQLVRRALDAFPDGQLFNVIGCSKEHPNRRSSWRGVCERKNPEVLVNVLGWVDQLVGNEAAPELALFEGLKVAMADSTVSHVCLLAGADVEDVASTLDVRLNGLQGSKLRDVVVDVLALNCNSASTLQLLRNLAFSFQGAAFLARDSRSLPRSRKRTSSATELHSSDPDSDERPVKRTSFAASSDEAGAGAAKPAS